MKDEAISVDGLRRIAGFSFSTKRPSRLGVAVSGGGDSVACLDVMHWHAGDLGFAVDAVTVDHGLRAEAADEITLVAGFCAERGIPHSVLRWEWDGTGNLQAAARVARYSLIGAWARARGIDTVALGHTQDDVAETFLMRLQRSSGIDGLSKMENRFERDGIAWLRPLLFASRDDLRLYLKQQDIAWIEDASNSDTRFDRVQVRQALDVLEPLGIDTATVAEVAHNVSMARYALNEASAEIVRSYGTEQCGDLALDIQAFRGRQPEFARRIGVAALRWVGSPDYVPRRYAQLAGLMEWAVGGETMALHGCLLTGDKDTRRVTREYNAVKDLVCPTDQLWDGRWRLDGPHDPSLEIRALGEAVKDTPWRDTGVPRQSLLASPAIWQGDTLVAAPVAGLPNGWTAEATGRGKFADFLISR